MPKKKCLNNSCKGTKIHCRGLCSPCYRTAAYLVSRGAASWDELEKAGRVLPKKDREGVSKSGSKTKWFLSK